MNINIGNTICKNIDMYIILFIMSYIQYMWNIYIYLEYKCMYIVLYIMFYLYFLMLYNMYIYIVWVICTYIWLYIYVYIMYYIYYTYHTYINKVHPFLLHNMCVCVLMLCNHSRLMWFYPWVSLASQVTNWYPHSWRLIVILSIVQWPINVYHGIPHGYR